MLDLGGAHGQQLGTVKIVDGQTLSPSPWPMAAPQDRIELPRGKHERWFEFVMPK